MFSVIFPGQGSQAVGMAKNLYDNFAFVKELFQKSDNILNQNLSKIILEGPKNELDLTENTQPCIFLVSYCIAEMIKKEINFNLNKAEYFAGHSLGEYTALTVSESLSFEKMNIIEGRLWGIKGQYLLFDDGSVLNIRKHNGYNVSLES